MSSARRSRAALFSSISLAALTAWSLAAGPVAAQDNEVEELVVTATRRELSVQDAPINIAAVGSEIIEQQGLTNLAEAANWVPGFHLVDGGGRTSDRVIVRGLNVDSLNQTDVLGNNAGGTVATYLGEIPIYIDLKLNDMQRIEFLLGPQGTLYGAGTLGGAIRYIPNRPRFSETTFEVRSEGYMLAHAESASYDVGGTFNLPLGETFAIRGSLDYRDDSGFTDYDFVVNEIGVSNPNIIDPSDPGYDLRQVSDADWEHTLSGRLAARWRPTEWLDANLTYYYQKQKVGARTLSHKRGLIKTDDYVSAKRVLEPNERENQLIALEWTADLGFAELTSATGFSKYEEHGQRDQTDLLIALEYSYEAFPGFTSFTREDEEDETFSQEVRLVSKYEGPLSWILGGFYNHQEVDGVSREFTPGFDRYAVDVWGTGGAYRPDSLEYIAPGTSDLTEKAAFGEITYEITEAWQVTGGLRYYDYKLKSADAVDFPLLYTSIDPDGRGPNDVFLEFNEAEQKDDGWLFKINTSYKVNPDILVYGTISEGYRIGGDNGISPCPEPLGNFQNVCALPDELASTPDKTTNFEVGAHTQWLDNRLTLNGSVYFIKWKNPQLLSSTVNGSGTIIKNAGEAESKGMDLSLAFEATENLTFRGSFAYTDAELTKTATRIVGTILSPNAPHGPGTSPFGVIQLDGEPGDRLPGSPKTQATFFVDYKRPLANGWEVEVNYGFRAIGDVFTRVGNRGGALKLPSYSIHNASIALRGEDWSATLYVDNIFDTFAESGAQSNSRYNQLAADENGDPVYVRTFFTNPLPPRAIGIRLTKKFGG